MSQEFPKLMWYADGREITVHSQSEQDEKLADGAALTPDGKTATVDAEAIADASLSGELVTEAAETSDEVNDVYDDGEEDEVSDEASKATKKKKGKK